MTRRIAAAILAIAVLAPASASAASKVETVGDSILVDGDAAPNAITVTREADFLVIAENGATVTDADEDDNCAQDGPRVRCDQVGVTDLVAVRGLDGNDTLTADTGDFVDVELSGGAGDDVLNSSAVGEFTRLLGGDGNDTLNARTGYLGTSDSGDAGNDTFNGNPQDYDSFEQEPGAYTFNGGTRVFSDPICGVDPELCPDEDYIDYEEGPVTVTLDGVANDGRAGEGDNVGLDVEEIGGSPANDVISAAGTTTGRRLGGGGGDDALTGGAGDDVLFGADGADQLAGGAGNDALRSGEESGAPAPDRLDGGDGDDDFLTGPGADDILGGPGVDSVGFFRTADNGTPISFDITLDDVANDGPKGAGEADNVHADVDNVATGAGADRIVGSANPQQLSGGFGNDEIDGGGGVDVIDGGNGADALVSRDLGFDVVNCGAGADPPVQGDEGDRLENCETSTLTPLTPPPDTTNPTVTLSGSRSLSAKAFGKARGVSVSAKPNEPSILVGEALAKGMIARAGDLVLGQKTLPLSNAGSRKITIKFSRSYVRAIQRKLRKKAYSVTVRVTATDAAGNRTVANRKITIKKAPRTR